jgi:hypothetical protein
MFNRILRFRDSAGTIHFGELNNQIIVSADGLVDKEVEVYTSGAAPWDDNFKLSGECAVVKEVRISLYYHLLFLK